MDGVRYRSHLVIRLAGERRTEAYLPLPLRSYMGEAHAQSAGRRAAAAAPGRQPRRQLRA